MIDTSLFDELEKKISDLILFGDRLRKDNEELKKQVKKLQDTVSEKEKQINQMKTESEGMIGMRSEIDHYREKESRIHSKVEALLEKLKSFDKIQ